MQRQTIFFFVIVVTGDGFIRRNESRNSCTTHGRIQGVRLGRSFP